MRLNGRKRHLLVDTSGLVLNDVVHPANIPDRAATGLVLTAITTRYPTLRHPWVDAGYTGAAVRHVAHHEGVSLHIVHRLHRWVRVPTDQEPSPMPTGFQFLPRRWVVESTFAWLGRWRRLSKYYEELPATEEAWIYLAMSMLRLAKAAQ